jgi:hypothetical protein
VWRNGLRSRAISGAAIAVLLGLTPAVRAQLKGHYIPGFTGLSNGSQGPPGINVILPIFFYTTDTIKDDEGNTTGANPRINATFLGRGFTWVTNVKILGGNLGGSALPIAFMKQRLEGASLDVPGSLGFTDITVQPFQLGWHKPRADYVAGYSVFFPTGEWELGGRENSGLGMYSHDFQGGATLRLDEKRAWTFSTLLTYEVHSQKKDTDIKVGDILTLEGGLGKAFYKMVGGPIPRITNIGLVYYGQFKTTADSGPLLTPLLGGVKDRVFGIGGEVNVFLPKPKLLLGVRVVPEFGARNRTQGVSFLITVAYAAKSLVETPAP